MLNIKRNATLCENVNEIKMRLLDYGHAHTNEDWLGHVVSPMYARLYYILGGKPYVIINGERTELEIGKCYLFPTGFSFKHACESSMEQIYFHLNINNSGGIDLLRSAECMMEFTPSPESTERLKRYACGEKPTDSLYVKNIIYADILTMLDKYGIELAATRYSRCVGRAIDCMKQKMSLGLSVSEIAAQSFVSESTLAKRFKAEVGMTVGCYNDELILFEAEQLLLNTDLSVQQISERFGFCDQFYFSRRFKKKYGETPQKYRKLMLI